MPLGRVGKLKRDPIPIPSILLPFPATLFLRHRTFRSRQPRYYSGQLLRVENGGLEHCSQFIHSVEQGSILIVHNAAIMRSNRR